MLVAGAVTDQVQPRLMLWPYRSFDADAAVVAMPPNRVREVLLSTRLFMHDPTSGAGARTNHWLIKPGSNRQNLHGVAQTLSTSVPCYRIPVGNDSAPLADRIGTLQAANTRAG